MIKRETKNVKRIEKNAFNQCFKLRNIQLPEGLTYIGDDAFFGYHIGNMVIPSSVTYYGGDVMLYLKSRGFYQGTFDDWQKVEKGRDYYDSHEPEEEFIYYYSETKPTDSGNYWHYVKGVPKKW